jgi:hypothetical protein
VFLILPPDRLTTYARGFFDKRGSLMAKWAARNH